MAEATQTSKQGIILQYMKNGGRVTDMKAVELCQSYRLSAIIYNLRKAGYNVQDRWLRNENTGSRYKEYFLPRELTIEDLEERYDDMPTPF